MGATWMWIGREVRRGARGAVLLVLLIGLGGAVVVGAIAGARRTDTALARMQASTDAADVRVQYQSEDPIDDEVLQALRAHPDVEVATPLFFTLAFSPESDYDLAVFSSPDPDQFREIDRFVMVDGRLPRVDRPDEVVLNPFTADVLGVEVGDSFELQTLSPQQLEEESYETGPVGPPLPLTAVGIGRIPDAIASLDLAVLFGSPAFHERYAGSAGGYGPTVDVLARDGTDPLATVEEALEGFTFGELILDTGDEVADRISDGTRVVVIGLQAFALAAALGVVVATSQALHRRLASRSGELPILEAIGCTRRDRVLGLVGSVVPIAVLGSLVAVGVSALGSSLAPIGRARLAEPHPGLAVDRLALLLGGLGIFVVTLLLAAVASVRVDRVARSSVTPASADRPGRLVRLLRAACPPPAGQLGVTLALEGGRGARAVPVRSAIVGASIGVAGVVGALTFAASLGALVDSPEQQGWNWTFTPDVQEGDLAALAAMPGVESVGVLTQREVVIGGRQVMGMSVEEVDGRPSLTVVAGRAPDADGEIALGPKLADQLGVEVGDTVEVVSPDGTRSLTMTGQVLLPAFDDIAFAEGVGLTPATLEEVAVTDGDDRVIVSFDDSVTADRAAEQVRAEFPESMSIYAFPTSPEDVANLAEVRSVPRALAAFLVLLAVAAVGHALASGVQRRRRDLGIVRSVGFTRRDVRRAIVTQSLTTVGIGLVIGVPAGIVVGRTAWAIVAQDLGVSDLVAVPASSLLVFAAGALVAAVLLGELAGRSAVRQRTIDSLRPE